MKNIWILAGETSGDIYGARLVQELRDIALGLIEAMPDSQQNPLNNIRNLKNTIAALARFEEFRNKVQQTA